MSDVKLSDAYLIVKRDVYYKPNAQGYTGVKDYAGRYTLAEVAERFPNKDSPNQDGMYCIHEDDAPDYSKGCYWDVRLEHQRDKALAEITALQARLAEAEKERDDADSRARAAFADAASNHIRFAEATNRIEDLEDALKLNQDLDAISVAAVNELSARTKEAVETLRKGFKSGDPTTTAAAIILAIAQLEGHGE